MTRTQLARLTAGVLIVASVLLGILVNKVYLVLSLIGGLDLLQSAFSNHFWLEDIYGFLNVGKCSR